MTDSVQFSSNHTSGPAENAASFEAVGLSGTGYVVSNTETLLSDTRSDLVDGPLNAFNHASTSGLDVVIDTGEAVVQGAPLCRDTQTTVTLAGSTTNQTVYVGWEPSGEDSLVVGLDSAFTAGAFQLAIWEFDTDATTVTTSTDLRDIGQQVNVQNSRYEGDGVAVDQATDASQLGGNPATSYLRSDIQDTLSAAVAFAASGTATGTLGNGNGEFSRAYGSAGDLSDSIQGGHGRYVRAWNAYYDGTDWRQESGTEPSAALALNNTDPGEGINDGQQNVSFAVAPATGTDGAIFTWQQVVSVNSRGITLNGGELVDFAVENRSNRPASPSVGQLIYRTDKD